MATWYDAQTGNAVGSTAQVTQTHQALPAGGPWLTAHLFYYLTLDGLAQGYDYVVGSTSSGPNALAGGACNW